MLLSATVQSALAGCAGLAALFVGSLYLAPASVRSRAHSDPVQIKWRFRSTALVCIVSPLVLLLWQCPEDAHVCAGNVAIEGHSLLEIIGVRLSGLVAACILPTSLMVVLFTGPLVDMGLSYARTSKGRDTGDFLFDFFPNCPEPSVQRFRNLVAAPFAEELVFRCCMGTLLTSSGMGMSSILLVSPLFFGLAHLHHCYGMVQQGVPVKRAALVSGVQMVYTSLFGALEMFIFLRTQHLAGVFLAHSWCNLMGLPSFAFLQPESDNYQFRHLIGLGYVVGLGLFAVGLVPCTDSAWYS